MDAALEDAERFIEADLSFHLVLATATQNAIFPVLINSIVDLLREQRKAIFFTKGGPQRGNLSLALCNRMPCVPLNEPPVFAGFKVSDNYRTRPEDPLVTSLSNYSC